MSIFSRLFNKSAEGDDKESPQDEGAAAEVKEGGSSRKPPPGGGAAGAEGKTGTMRPPAPSFDMAPPGANATHAAPVTTETTPAAVTSGSSDKKAPRAPNVSARTLTYATPSANAGPPAAAPSPPGTPPDARGLGPSRAKTTGTTAHHGSGATEQGASAPARARGAQPPGPPPPAPSNAAMWPATTAAALHSGPAATAPRTAARMPPDPSITTSSTADAASAKNRPAPARPKLAQDGAFFSGAAGAETSQSSNATNAAIDELLTLELSSNSRQKAAPALAHPPRGHAPERSAAPGLAAAASRQAASESHDVDSINLQTDLDAAFGAIVEPSRTGGAARAHDGHGSLAEVRDLFTALAANHMRQVRDFMIGVKWGESPRDAMAICEAATQSLLRAAREMELHEMCTGLEKYAEALKVVYQGNDTDGAAREALLSAYNGLAEQMPDVFGFDGERGQREAIIIHALLQQVPEVRKLTIDKIYAAGLTGLDVLFLAKPDDIAATTGISELIAARIVEKFRRYREEAAALVDATHGAERKRLAELLGELRQAHERYELSESEWLEKGRSERKHHRQARAEALLKIKVLLARLGEVERLKEIERVPFERKFVELEKYLGEAKAQA